MNTTRVLILSVLLLVGWPHIVRSKECGPEISLDIIQKMVDRLEVIQGNLASFQPPLIQEAANVVNNDAEYQKRINQQMFAERGYELGEMVDRSIDKVLLLAQIRSMMLDRRDVRVVDRHLAIATSSLGRTSARVRGGLNQLLPKLAKPAVAYEVSRLRDVVAEIENQFDSCESPSVRK